MRGNKYFLYPSTVVLWRLHALLGSQESQMVKPLGWYSGLEGNIWAHDPTIARQVLVLLSHPCSCFYFQTAINTAGTS